MWLYRVLDVVFPASYSAKLIFVAICAMVCPPVAAGTLLYMQIGPTGLLSADFAVFAMTSALGLVVLVGALVALLEPVAQLAEVMGQMDRRREYQPLPAQHKDSLGRMMIACNGIAKVLGARLDPRFSKDVLDPLTGLLDATAFAASLKRQGKGSLVRFRIDNLDELRREYGDVTADGLVATTSQMIRAEVRNGDLVGRVGDDEFGVWLKQAGRVVSRHVAERIATVIREETAKHPPGVTLSGGVAVRHDREEVEELSDRVVTAWKLACNHGDRVEMADPIQ